MAGAPIVPVPPLSQFIGVGPYPGVGGLPSQMLPVSTGGPGNPQAIQNSAGVYEYNAVGVKGAVTVNPAFAADFIASRFFIEYPVPGDNTPNTGVPSAPVAGMRPDAKTGAPDAFKNRAADQMSNAVLYGDGEVQPLLRFPWQKAYITPLSVFHTALNTVNRLMFNQPMPWFGAATSNPPIRAQYFTPPPINTHNLAAGTLNLQMQLGNLAIQGQQLTTDASNYFG